MKLFGGINRDQADTVTHIYYVKHPNPEKLINPDIYRGEDCIQCEIIRPLEAIKANNNNRDEHAYPYDIFEISCAIIGENNEKDILKSKITTFKEVVNDTTMVIVTGSIFINFEDYLKKLNIEFKLVTHFHKGYNERTLEQYHSSFKMDNEKKIKIIDDIHPAYDFYN